MVVSNTLSGSTTTALYPNPFFSMSQFYMPENTKSLFKWFSYFFNKDPIIGQGCSKMAAYPITDFVYKVEGDDQKMKERWKNLIEDDLNTRSFLVELGLDYFVFGNAFCSINVGFTRYLLCPHCKRLVDISNNDNIDNFWTYQPSGKEISFSLTCPKCNQEGVTKSIIDKPSNNPKSINFVRWAPENIDIDYYHLTGKSRYFYNIPNKTKQRIKSGKDKYLIKTTPLVHLQAVQNDLAVELDPQNLYHFKRTTLAEKDQGWGKSLIIHSLQRLFYLFTLRRAQESIATGHITPMDYIFPVETATVSPVRDMNLGAWMDTVREEFKHSRRDPNYIPISPVPINTARIGGDGKILLLGAEIDAGNKEVAAGMGFPLEFIFGGLSWSGSSVSLRLLENVLISHRTDLLRILKFIVRIVRRVTGWGACTIDMTELRMADDVQRMQLAMQLNSARQLSDQDLLAEFGWDVFEQWEKIKKEATMRNEISAMDIKAQALAQGESTIINAQFSAKANIAGQVATNQGGPQLEASLPFLQRDMQRINTTLQWMQLRLTYDQMLGITVPPPVPEGQGAPPPEGQGAPPQDQGQAAAEQASGQAADQQMGAAPAEPASTQSQQWNNPYYQSLGGPDSEAILKRWATKLLQMAPADQQALLRDIQQRSPLIYQKVVQYMKATPPGGTASDAPDMMQPLPENRPPRRTGGMGGGV